MNRPLFFSFFIRKNKNIRNLLFVILLCSQLSCEKECALKMESCIDYNLIPEENIANSWDLQKYLIKTNSTYLTGKDTCFASAIKLVPTQGFIDWRSNIVMAKMKEIYYINLTNYVDTSFWINFDPWDALREYLFIEIKNLQIGKIQIYNFSMYKLDTTLNYVSYRKMGDGGDVFDAKWELDIKENNNLEITSIDTIKHIVEGNFHFYFNLIEQSRLPPSWGIKYSDKVQFRCGKFKTKLIR